MSCPVCGIGLDEEAVEALILNHLTDIDSHDHDVVLDGSDVYSVTQNYADARPATQFIVPGLAAAAAIAAEWAPQVQSVQETGAVTVPKTATWTPVLSGVTVVAPAGWTTFDVLVQMHLRIPIPTGQRIHAMGRMSIDSDVGDTYGQAAAVVQNWLGTAPADSRYANRLVTGKTTDVAIDLEMWNHTGSDAAMTALTTHVRYSAILFRTS